MELLKGFSEIITKVPIIEQCKCLKQARILKKLHMWTCFRGLSRSVQNGVSVGGLGTDQLGLDHGGIQKPQTSGVNNKQHHLRTH